MRFSRIHPSPQESGAGSGEGGSGSSMEIGSPALPGKVGEGLCLGMTPKPWGQERRQWRLDALEAQPGTFRLRYG